MNHLNSIIIEGNLVAAPQLQDTPKGVPVCTFSIASNRFLKSGDGMEKEVHFFEVEVWEKLAEHCHHFGKKGRGVRVVGRLKQERWDSVNGKSNSRIIIVAEHAEFSPEARQEVNDE